MIEYHIQKALDAILVQRPDQLFQLGTFPVVFDFCSIAGVWGKKTDRIVSPVIDQGLSVYLPAVLHLIEFKNRHQLYGIDTQLF